MMGRRGTRSERLRIAHHSRPGPVGYRQERQTIREAASNVGITGRATQMIVADLVTEGYLIRSRQGRRNVYTIPENRPLRHPRVVPGCTQGRRLVRQATLDTPRKCGGLGRQSTNKIVVQSRVFASDRCRGFPPGSSDRILM
jgi:hypothetical protein